MPKCDICKNKIEELFLGKLKGTIIRKPGSGKHHFICFECQKKLRNKEQILQKL